MKIDQMRTHLTTLKLYLKKMEAWATQANELIYEVEERLMDLEDELHYQKYSAATSIQNLKAAVTHHVSPARLRIDHCYGKDIDLAAFVQEFSKLNTLKR